MEERQTGMNGKAGPNSLQVPFAARMLEVCECMEPTYVKAKDGRRKEVGKVAMD